MTFDEPLRDRLLKNLTSLYGDGARACLEKIEPMCGRHRFPGPGREKELWNQRDVVLITYGDQISAAGRTPLSAQKQFLEQHQLNDVINTVHILPFCPYSSDDGFSVIDFRKVDPNLGTWDDVSQLGTQYDLMFDLVLNHCSQQSEWFQAFLAGTEPYTDFFITVDTSADLSAVTRPRSLPLLTPFETDRGTQHVWTTFSADQIDLNFSCPDLLAAMLDVLLFYVSNGARIIRLDAIAYLWKQIGTTCIHLPQTHAVVKLMRGLIDHLAPGTILLTETNVPHAENVSYFGEGDEAQMVYQFSLAPLLLDAFLSADARPLNAWLTDLEQTGPGMTYFNFTASHDGIGVRPLEGLVSQERLEQLVEAVRVRGGMVSTKRNADGSDSPYELNVTYFSALGEPDGLPVDLHVRRFLSTQAIMVALRGIPGIYIHSLLGTANFSAGVEQTGRARTINRRKFSVDELQQTLGGETSAQHRVFDGYRRLLATRIAQPAFHPDAAQKVIDLGTPALIAFLRTSLDGLQSILVVANVTSENVRVDLGRFRDVPFQQDLLSGRECDAGTIELAAWQTAWLSE